MNRFMPVAASTLFVILAIILGGAASAGIVANAVIQLAAVFGIALAIVSRPSYPGGTQRALLLIFVAAALWVIVQLIPLPPSIWSGLPGRQLVAESYRLNGIPLPPRPFSLEPERTIGALLGLLPVIAAALIGMRAPRGGLIALYVSILAVMIVSVALGLAQRSTGLDSSFYIYTITNRGEAVGLFANSNHLATLCAVSIPAAMALFVARRGGTRPNSSWLLLVALVVVALLGIVASNSLAGFALSGVALASLYPLARLRRSDSKMRLGFRVVFGIAVLIVTVLVGFLLWSHLDSGTIAQGGEMGRATLWRRTLDGIAAFMPYGAGMGSFPAVFPAFEDPATVTRVFANHAHNDYLEMAMSGGAPGVLLMTVFGLWWLRTAVVIWRASTRDSFAEAATAMTAIILLHELVDYPLRTAAIGVIFGLCTGIMARPRRVVEPEDEPVRASRHVSA